MSGYGASGTDQPGSAASTTVELAVTGRLDHAAVPRVGAMFDAALDRQPGRIVVDVARCDYADAAGIALLLDLHRRGWRTGSPLTLRGPSARLRRLFEIARVDHVLRVESDSPTADDRMPGAGADGSGPPG